MIDKAPASERLGRGVLVATVLAFLAIALPVVWRGAPLADDFHNCMAPVDLGIGGFFAASWHFMGAVRPARFLEILLALGVCRHLPFGMAIAVPLLLTLAVALLTRGFLRDLDTPAPWADFGGAAWLLQPLGTEPALWPAALHVPLGLMLSLVALRLFHRGRHGRAALAALGAALSLEQVILALPVAAWLTAPPPERRRAATAAAGVALVVLTAFALRPGSDPRLHTAIGARLVSLVQDPVFLLAYPAVGLGLHSIPLAVRWAFPWSLVALAAGAAAGVLVARRVPAPRTISGRGAMHIVLGLAVLVAIVNAPVVLNTPHYGSPRIFAPTWLILSIGVPMLAARLHWSRPVLIGGAAGVCAAGALLSLSFSVWVRLVTADFNERAARIIAAEVPEGGDVAVCGVRRTVTPLAPRGSFAVHELVYDWSAGDALAYFTGRRAHIRLAGELWGRPCPRADEVDAVIEFDQLVSGAAR